MRSCAVPDLDTEQAIKDNAANLENCAALTLTTMADCIQTVRVIVDSLVEIVFYLGNLVMYVFEMLATVGKPGMRDQIIQQIMPFSRTSKTVFSNSSMRLGTWRTR